jgi:hypothetical protein
MPILSQEEIKQCRVFFTTFDQDNNSSIDDWELRLALEGKSIARPFCLVVTTTPTTDDATVVANRRLVAASLTPSRRPHPAHC